MYTTYMVYDLETTLITWFVVVIYLGGNLLIKYMCHMEG